MADGCGPKAGYDITVNGIDRTFRDRKTVAIESAIYLKERNKDSVVKIICRETGLEMLILPDGRIA